MIERTHLTAGKQGQIYEPVHDHDQDAPEDGAVQLQKVDQREAEVNK